MSTITIDPGDNAGWYVRAAVVRGILSLEEQIAEAERIITKYEADETLSARGTVLQMTRNMKAYNEQLLSEMRQYIPEELL